MIVVYFIQATPSTNIKIGVSTNVKSRLAALQSSNHEELSLLGAVHGGQDLEKDLHQLFAKYHIRGEWFKYSDEIIEFIDNNALPFHMFDFYAPYSEQPINPTHPVDNVVYYPIGTKVICEGQLLMVVDLDIRTVDHFVNYAVKLPSGQEITVPYHMLSLPDGKKFNESDIYDIDPKDELQRRKQTTKKHGHITKGTDFFE